MSDLQCPARVVLLRQEGAAEALEWLRHERVAHVYSSASPVAARAALALARELDVGHGTLHELSVVDPQDLSGTVLDQVADLHRGETLVVVAELAGAAEGPVVVVQRDGDGWRQTGRV